MTIRLADGRTTFIDFRERAPGKASHDMYLDANGKPTRDSIEGWRSSGVPGTVRGFELAHSKYGAQEMGRRDRAGDRTRLQWISGQLCASRIAATRAAWRRSPESKRIFQKDGAFYDVDEIFKLPELAAHADPHREKRRERILRRRNRAKTRRGDGQERRPDHACRSQELQSRRTQAAHRKIQKLRRSSPRPRPVPAASGFCRFSGCSKAPAMRKPASAPRPASATWPKRCAASTPIAANTWAIPISSKYRSLGLLDPAYIQKRRATIDPRSRHAQRSGQARQARRQREHRDHALLRRRCRRQRRRRDVHA